MNYFATFLAVAMTLTACTQSPSYQKLEGQTMGTSYHIRFKAPTEMDTFALQHDIEKRLTDINQSMSTYLDDSTITTFNRLAAGDAITIDPDFIQVLEDSRVVYQQSHHAFDPTVMPLVDLWGFGKKLTVDRLNARPTPEEILAIQPLIGMDKIVLVDDQLSKTQDGVSLDFSAIAKGYGVDAVANVLKSRGIDHYMVEIGGEVATLGVNEKGKFWNIAIDAPVVDSTISNRTILTILPLNNAHMATSGNYRNHLEWQGISYGHAINPSTAHPVVNGAPSVTVLHKTTTLADAWATALSAIPQTEAIALAKQADIAALFVQPGTDGNWQTIETKAMTAYRQSVAQ